MHPRAAARTVETPRRGLPDERIASALERIERMARFRPARDYPLYNWWHRVLRRGSR